MKDLISFGRYVLSKHRTTYVTNNLRETWGNPRSDNEQEAFDKAIRNKLLEVTDEDLKNWRNMIEVKYNSSPEDIFDYVVT